MLPEHLMEKEEVCQKGHLMEKEDVCQKGMHIPSEEFRAWEGFRRSEFNEDLTL